MSDVDVIAEFGMRAEDASEAFRRLGEAINAAIASTGYFRAALSAEAEMEAQRAAVIGNQWRSHWSVLEPIGFNHWAWMVRCSRRSYRDDPQRTRARRIHTRPAKWRRR